MLTGALVVQWASKPAASVDRSKELIGELMRHPDYGEGVRALVEKRAPRFGT